MWTRPSDLTHSENVPTCPKAPWEVVLVQVERLSRPQATEEAHLHSSCDCACSILFPWKSSTHSTLQKLAKTWQPATGSFKVKFWRRTAFDQLDSLSFTCSTASALHPSICDHCQSKHGQMGPPFSILFPHVMRRYRVWRRFPRISFTAPKICECCSTAETVQPAQKADTESHQPSLPVMGGSLPQLLPWGNTTKINQARKQWKQFLSNLTELNMEYEHGAVSCFAWCRMWNVHPELLEVQKLRGGCKMLQVCLAGSLTLLFPFLGRVSNKKCLLLCCFVQFYTRQKEWSRLRSNPDLALAHLQPSLLPNNFVWTWSSRNVGYGL